ncbi:MAG: thiamine pyrophosphate-dependent enzyme, partial [Halobacteriales archaeon]|nr:thiamine pyrophosphate-dependent enzyme [Halobacteriales archaeon]
ATHVGAAAALQETDWMQTAWRQYGAHIHRGRSLLDILLFWLRGYEEWDAADWDRPEGPSADQRRLPKIVAVGTQVPQAVGHMWGRKYLGTDEAGLVTIGEGATSKGDFHEGLNFAGVMDVPIVILTINNQYAISQPVERQTRSETFAQKATAYGFDGILVDGNDPLAMYRTARDALEKARTDHEPTLIEGLTYRLGAHSTSDDPSLYRDDAEVDQWAELDPLPRYQTFLEDRDILSVDEAETIREQAEEAVREAANEAIAIADDQSPDEVFDKVYANPPPELERQWEQFRAFYDRHGEAAFRGW